MCSQCQAQGDQQDNRNGQLLLSHWVKRLAGVLSAYQQVVKLHMCVLTFLSRIDSINVLGEC